MAEMTDTMRAVIPLFLTTAQTAYRNSIDHASISARTWVSQLVSYAPVFTPVPYPVKRVFWVNGSTITSTNVDFGIYTEDGTRIYNTGSTAMSGVTSVQYITPATDFILSPGKYYFAWTCNNTTSRGWAFGGSANSGRLLGMLEETTGSFGLPATMTPVAYARAWGPCLCGVTRTTAGF